MFGVGFGWLTEEFAALDVPFDERVSAGSPRRSRCSARRGPAVRSATTAGTSRSAASRSRSVRPRCPLVLGGNTERALRRAARLGDGWFSSGTPPIEESVRLRGELQRLRAEADDAVGRERTFELTFRMEGCDPAAARRYADEGFETGAHLDRPGVAAGEPLAVKRARTCSAAAAPRPADRQRTGAPGGSRRMSRHCLGPPPHSADRTASNLEEYRAEERDTAGSRQHAAGGPPRRRPVAGGRAPTTCRCSTTSPTPTSRRCSTGRWRGSARSSTAATAIEWPVEFGGAGLPAIYEEVFERGAGRFVTRATTRRSASRCTSSPRRSGRSARPNSSAS